MQVYELILIIFFPSLLLIFLTRKMELIKVSTIYLFLLLFIIFTIQYTYSIPSAETMNNFLTEKNKAFSRDAVLLPDEHYSPKIELFSNKYYATLTFCILCEFMLFMSLWLPHVVKVYFLKEEERHD